MVLTKLFLTLGLVFTFDVNSIIEKLNDPKVSAQIVTYAIGRPDIYDNLIAICHRESRCKKVGIHEIDAHISPKSYWGQVKLGHLDRTCQKHGEAGRWSTRGPWGLNAAAHWPYFYKCYQPELLDYNLISAWVATHKYINVCESKNKSKKLSSWCPKVHKRKPKYKM